MNMIKNSSFEGITRPGGWTRHTHAGQSYRKIFVPEGWVAWWVEGQAAGDFKRPEIKVIPKITYPPARIHDGNWSVQASTIYGRMNAGLYQVVTGLTPGKLYELSAYVHAWSTHRGMPNDRDPVDYFIFKVGVSFGKPNPFGDVTWGAKVCIYNKFAQTPKLQFRASENGKVVIYVKACSLWNFRISDMYLDKIELHEKLKR